MLALRGGERLAVVEDEWHDAFAVVTRGRVQLELRDGRPGPVLGRDAGFWLRGTGVRALRNPGRRPATVSVLTPRTPAPTRRPGPAVRRWADDGGTAMGSTSNADTRVLAGPATDRPGRGMRRLAGTGAVAVLAAMAATTLAAALARALGVEFEIPDGGETIPLPGFAVVTGVLSAPGVLVACALLRWSARPAVLFVRTAVALTAVSLVPPVVSGAATATVAALVVLHLVAAAVVVPALARGLRARAR